MTLGADVDTPSSFFYLRVAADALTKDLYLATSISVKGKIRTLDKQTKRRQREERSKGVRTCADGSMCLVYELQASAQDHHNRRATCQG